MLLFLYISHGVNGHDSRATIIRKCAFKQCLTQGDRYIYYVPNSGRDYIFLVEIFSFDNARCCDELILRYPGLIIVQFQPGSSQLWSFVGSMTSQEFQY